MKKTFFECRIRSIMYLTLIIPSLLLALVFIIAPIVVYGVNNIISTIFALLGVMLIGCVSGLINQKDVLNRVIVTEEGVYRRKIIKNVAYIKWYDVKRAETIKLRKYPTIMIALEGYDEYSQKETVIYVESKEEIKLATKKELSSHL